MIFRLAVVFLLLSAATAQAESGCTLKRVLTLTSRPDSSGHLIVPAILANQPTHLLVDTGGGWSLISEKMADALGLRRKAMHMQQFVDAAGGRLSHYVSVPSMTLGSITIDRPVDFVVMKDNGDRSIEEMGGTIGLNFLRQFDVEIDNAAGKISLFLHHECDDGAHWAEAFAEFNFRFDDRGLPIARVNVDGEEVNAVLDTGSTVTTIDLDFARRHLGITPDSPGVTLVGEGMLPSGKRMQTYRYRLSALSLSGVRFENVPVELMDMRDFSLILGMNELKKLHLYFAFKRKKIYVTAADAK